MTSIAWARTSQEGVNGITPNKLYMNARWETTGSHMYIMNDSDREIFILEKGCCFLGGGDWEFISPDMLKEVGETE